MGVVDEEGGVGVGEEGKVSGSEGNAVEGGVEG